jgi:hypothetical protein
LKTWIRRSSFVSSTRSGMDGIDVYWCDVSDRSAGRGRKPGRWITHYIHAWTLIANFHLRDGSLENVCLHGVNVSVAISCIKDIHLQKLSNVRSVQLRLNQETSWRFRDKILILISDYIIIIIYPCSARCLYWATAVCVYHGFHQPFASSEVYWHAV